ncbi:hypothetical protein [cf. Phormidesmis sp. LEGE 11477]|uniref:hypothetical protein n=1 Tax=cf. Phormidesmis sp. LEGE 11477 TaxID=1828680 RepID=UPI001D1480CB|nr:hypothetical protein [cf. Phormidesmis sp. LEGE 11477]
MLVKLANILDPQATYTFSKYFDLNYDSEEIFAELGFAFENAKLSLPKFEEPISFAAALSQQLEFAMTLTNLTTEIARRETLISPI